MNQNASVYRIFASEGGDWYIAAKKVGDEITVLGEGHFRSDALDAILKDMGVEVPLLRRPMDEDGNYEPRKRDWK